METIMQPVVTISMEVAHGMVTTAMEVVAQVAAAVEVVEVCGVVHNA